MRHPRKLSGRIITWLFHSTFVTPLFFTSTDQTALSIKCYSILYHFLISLSIHTICIVHLFYLVQRSFFCLLHTLRTDSPPASLKLRKITGHWFIHNSHSFWSSAIFKPSNKSLLSLRISKKEASILMTSVFPNMRGLVKSVISAGSVFTKARISYVLST